MIKAGYQITISSWENDGDNYKDITISGLTKDRVKYTIAMCSLFTSIKHGNLYDASHDSHEVFLARLDMLAIASAYADVLEPDEIEYIGEEPCEYMATFIGSNTDFTFRVFDSYKVYFMPIDIADITNDPDFAAIDPIFSNSPSR